MELYMRSIAPKTTTTTTTKQTNGKVSVKISAAGA